VVGRGWECAYNLDPQLATVEKMIMMTTTQACTERRTDITVADLPLSCPMRDQAVWDAHPRVYLPIEQTETGEFTCPYCDTKYVLIRAK